MTPFRRAAQAVKAFAMRFAIGARWSWSSVLGRTRFDYAGVVGDGRGNAIVVACISWMCRTWPEAPIRVSVRNADGEFVPVPDHPLVELIDRPNPYYSGELLWMATLADWTLGNAYWLKVRSPAGRPVQLWWVPSSMMEPKWPDDGSEFISHYEYRPNGQPVSLPPSEVVHFRNGFDPQNMRKGLSQLASLAREIFTDDEAANYSASLLSNLGVPGLIIAPADDYNPSQEDVDRIKEQAEQRFGGDNRGRTMVMTGKTSVHTVSFNPREMVLKDLRRLPEERVSAIFGVPAVVVGLGAGLDRSTYANYAEAREAAYESNIIPTQRLFAAELRTQLLPDFGDASRAKVRLDFDLSQVRVLQADQDKLHARAREDLKAGMITLGQAQAMIGLDPGPDGDILYLPINVTPTAPADLLAPPALPAPAETLRALPGGKLREPVEHKAADPSPAFVRLRTRLTDRAERDVARFLSEQAERVISRLESGAKARKAADPNDLLPDEETLLLAAVLNPSYQAALEGVHDLVQAQLDVDFGLDDPTVRAFINETGANIPGITATTRDAIRAALIEGEAAGESIPLLAKRLRGLPAFDRARSLLVARTEMGYAVNGASLNRYEASGVVVGVRVFDGDGDGVCQAANGRTLTLADARTFPRLAHPNCVRAFGPLTDVSQLEAAA